MRSQGVEPPRLLPRRNDAREDRFVLAVLLYGVSECVVRICEGRADRTARSVPPTCPFAESRASMHASAAKQATSRSARPSKAATESPSPRRTILRDVGAVHSTVETTSPKRLRHSSTCERAIAGPREHPTGGSTPSTIPTTRRVHCHAPVGRDAGTRSAPARPVLRVQIGRYGAISCRVGHAARTSS